MPERSDHGFLLSQWMIHVYSSAVQYWALDAPRRKTSTLYADRAWSQARPPLRFLDAPRRTELYACYTHAIRRLKILYAKLDASKPGLCNFLFNIHWITVTVAGAPARTEPGQTQSAKNGC